MSAQWDLKSLFLLLLFLFSIAISRNSFKVLPELLEFGTNYSLNNNQLHSNLEGWQLGNFVTNTIDRAKSLNTLFYVGRIQNVKDLIKLHEGTKKWGGLHVLYRDSADKCGGRGYLTIGHGHFIGCNVNSKNRLTATMIGRSGWNGEGLTNAEANRLFDYDFDRHLNDLYRALPWIKSLDEVRRAVLLDMNFNMGTNKLLEFKSTLSLIESGQYAKAASNLTHTPWYRQTGRRSKRICKMLKTGQW